MGAKQFTKTAVLGCTIVAVILIVDDADAQEASAGPGARVRIITRSELTPRDIAEMAGAPKGAEVVPEGRAMMSVHTREGLNLVVPVPGIRFSGVLLAVDDYVLTIKPDGAPVSLTVPRRAIDGMERSVGRRSRARYAGIGALTGFGGGGLVGLVTHARHRAGDAHQRICRHESRFLRRAYHTSVFRFVVRDDQPSAHSRSAPVRRSTARAPGRPSTTGRTADRGRATRGSG